MFSRVGEGAKIKIASAAVALITRSFVYYSSVRPKRRRAGQPLLLTTPLFSQEKKKGGGRGGGRGIKARQFVVIGETYPSLSTHTHTRII